MNLKSEIIKSFRYVKNFFFSNAAILGYHRINKSIYDPFELNVSPENFTEQLQIIKKYAIPLSLSELIQKLKDGKLTSKHVAITFDDGYSDNFYKAKPILNKFDIPATVFIVTGKLNSEYWWDELERLILTAAIIPEEINIKFNSGSFFWSLNNSQHKNPKLSLFFSLYKLMQNLDLNDVQIILDQLNDWINGELISDRRYRTLSHDELLLLTNDHLVEAGSHTITHSNPATANIEQLEYEFVESKRFLEDLLGKPVSGFAYPLGVKTSVSANLLQKSGYEYACASYNDFVYRKSDRFSLPRFWMPDWNGEEFEKWFKKWRN